MASGLTLDELVGSVRSPGHASDPLEATLAFRAKDWSLLQDQRNNSGMSFRTDLAVAMRGENFALCARIGEIHWVVVFERLLWLIDDAFATLAGISNSEPMFGSEHSFDGMKLLHPPGFRFLSKLMGEAVSPSLDSASKSNALIAAFMSHISLRFIMDHEYFHAYHGHVLLAEEFFGHPVVFEVDKYIASNERNMRRALEFQADRSAFMQMLRDVASGDVPTNEAVDRLTLDERLVLSIVAVLVVVGLMGAEDLALGVETEINPAAERRASHLISPTIGRGLAAVGFNTTRINVIGAAVHRAVDMLAALHNVFRAPSLAFALDQRDVNSIENRHLEWIYFLSVGPKLRDHQFFPPDRSFKDASQFSIRPDWRASVQKP
jgi:hypothetical protein